MDAKTDNATAPVAAAADDDEAPDFESTDEGNAPLPDPKSNFEHTLIKPIQAHGEEVTVLRWREPTGGDIERAGNPVRLDISDPNNPTLGFGEKKMAAMISQLCMIPPSSVRQMTAKDWNAVAWKLFGFFTPPGG